MRLTNLHGISLPIAVWLLADDYDYINDPLYVSATTLLKSTKQIVLSRRAGVQDREIDISSFLASRFGSAIHDSQEKAWHQHGRKAMKMLGYPEEIYNNLTINPTPEELAANTALVPVYVERRSFREVVINGKTYRVGGKFDTVLEGRLFDTKTTSVYAYILGSKDDSYAWQGSIYRWLNPGLITSNHIHINFLFTDWQKSQAKQNPNYPQTKSVEHPVPLFSDEVTQRFIEQKLTELDESWDRIERELPPCNDKELWRSEPTYKYYSDPAKAVAGGRSTRNFDNIVEANAFLAEKGKGIVKTVPGAVKACDYCPAFTICKQKDAYYGN